MSWIDQTVQWLVGRLLVHRLMRMTSRICWLFIVNSESYDSMGNERRRVHDSDHTIGYCVARDLSVTLKRITTDYRTYHWDRMKEALLLLCCHA